MLILEISRLHMLGSKFVCACEFVCAIGWYTCMCGPEIDNELLPVSLLYLNFWKQSFSLVPRLAYRGWPHWKSASLYTGLQTLVYQAFMWVLGSLNSYFYSMCFYPLSLSPAPGSKIFCLIL